MIAPGLLHHDLALAEHACRLERASPEVRARALRRLTDYLFPRTRDPIVPEPRAIEAAERPAP